MTLSPIRTRKFWLLVPLATVTLLLFASCSDNKNTVNINSGATATQEQTPGGGTPQTIDTSGVPELEDGTLTIGSDIAYAPIEYYEEGTQNAKGMDVDLMNAIGEALGVSVEFKQVAEFAGIVQDLKTKRYDIVVSAISITPEREAEIDFIPYFGPVGTGIVVPKGNPKAIAGPEDLCGLKVAAQVGTYQVDQVTALNEGACTDDPISLTTFPDNPTAVQELALGRVDAELADDPVAAYSAAQSAGNLVEIASTRFEAAPYGIGVRKDSTELKALLAQALQQIRDDGTYLAVLRNWDQEEFAVQ